MRVLFWSEQFWPNIGGIEVWGARLLGALQQRGNDFTYRKIRNATAVSGNARYPSNHGPIAHQLHRARP